MIDFTAARRMMVDGQVRTSDVSDLRIIAAMLELPRERFVPESKAALVYLDADAACHAWRADQAVASFGDSARVAPVASSASISAAP